MGSAVHREIARLLATLRRDWTIAVNKQLSVLGFSLHEYVILQCLSECEEAPQSQLAHDAAIDVGAASRLVRQLVRARIVSTRIDARDRRQRLVKLTAKGRTLLRSLSPVVDDKLKPYLSGLTSEEEEELLRLLRKAREAVTLARPDNLWPPRPAAFGHEWREARHSTAGDSHGNGLRR